MESLGIHHVSVNVVDVAQALAFYVDVLGLSPRHDRPDFGFGGAWLDAGSQQVHLVEGEPARDQGQHFAVRVPDIAVAVDQLRQAGTDVSDAIEVGTGRQAFLHDPAGNLIEIHQAA